MSISIFSKPVLDAHRGNEIFINGLAEPPKPYSMGWSLADVAGQPETLGELLRSINRHSMLVKDEWTGPQGFNSLVTHAATLESDDPKKDLMEFFTSQHETGVKLGLSLNLYPGEEYSGFYKALIMSMESAALRGAFPVVPLLNVVEDSDWDLPAMNAFTAYAFRYGGVHYQNYKSGTIEKELLTGVSEDPDLSNLKIRQGGVVGNADNRGVLGHVTLNLPLLARKAISEVAFFADVEVTLGTAMEALDEKRAYLEQTLNEGGFPATGRYLDSFKGLSGVVTLSGMNEALQSSIDAGTGHVAGKAVTYKLLEKLTWLLEDHQSESGNLVSLEAYPSMEAGAALAEVDPDHVFYTDSTNLPPDHGDDLWDSLEHQKKYHSIYTGGAVFEAWLDYPIDYSVELVLLARRVLDIFGYNYFTVNPSWSRCPKDGYIPGEAHVCPVCGSEAVSYTWIDGFIRPVESIHEGLKEAQRRRVTHSIKSR